MIGRLRGPRSRRERSRIDVPARLAALEQALELAEGLIDHAVVERARQVATKATERLRHGSTHTLVSLLGATGSGKSSVTNALVGSDVATTGVRRPTTSSTLACVWGDDDASALLDWLEVPNRYEVPDSAVPRRLARWTGAARRPRPRLGGGRATDSRWSESLDTPTSCSGSPIPRSTPMRPCISICDDSRPRRRDCHGVEQGRPAGHR